MNFASQDVCMKIEATILPTTKEIENSIKRRNFIECYDVLVQNIKTSKQIKMQMNNESLKLTILCFDTLLSVVAFS